MTDAETEQRASIPVGQAPPFDASEPGSSTAMESAQPTTQQTQDTADHAQPIDVKHERPTIEHVTPTVSEDRKPSVDRQDSPIMADHEPEPAKQSEVAVEHDARPSIVTTEQEPSASPTEKYIHWDAPGVEVIQPGEKEKIQAVSEQFKRMQMMNFNEHHHCLRGTHLKTQGCVIGKFIIHDDLPPHLAQGMFAHPGTHDVIMRYSSLTPKLLGDNIPAPRGIGMKIFNVPGEKLWSGGPEGGKDQQTQDFTFNNYPVLELRDPKTTHEIAGSLERNWNDLGRFGEECAAREDADVACRAGGLERQYMVAMNQYSQSAYRYGSYVAKFAVIPSSPAQLALRNTYISDSDPINILSHHTRAFHQSHRVTYDFRVQLLQDLSAQPVDDIGIEWPEDRFPFVTVAHLEFEPQDSWLPEFRVWWDDRITCNSWHGLVAHRPLGSTNRMRRVVYAESRKLRLRVNGFRDYVEPSGLKDVPAPLPAVRVDREEGEGKPGQNWIS